MTFPGAGAQIYRNEAGEPLGWDHPSYDDGPDPDDFDECDYDDENFDECDYDDEDPDGGTEWVICDECGNEYEDGDPEIKQHEQETGHKRWS